MADMAQNAYYPGGEGYYYINTPSPQQSILSSNNYGSHQTTPQTDHSDFSFSESHIASRSNSEPFLYQQQVVPQLGAPIILPQGIQGIPISHHLRSEDKQSKTNKRTQCVSEENPSEITDSFAHTARHRLARIAGIRNQSVMADSLARAAKRQTCPASTERYLHPSKLPRRKLYHGRNESLIMTTSERTTLCTTCSN
jgi:hypothetical protein